MQLEYRFSSISYRGLSRGPNDIDVDYRLLPRNTYSHSLSLRDDLFVNEQWRLISAVNYDQFSLPDTTTLTFQFATTYQFLENLVGRVNLSQANRVPFASETFGLLDFTAPSGLFVEVLGDNDLRLAETDMIEFGLRGVLGANTAYDFELWAQRADNYNGLTFTTITAERATLETVQLETVIEQVGMTLGIKHLLGSTLSLHYSFTLQETTINDFFSNLIERDEFIESAESESTPAWIADVNLNWQILPTLNANLNGYFMDQRRLDATFFTPKVADSLSIINAQIRFEFMSDWIATLNARNLSDSQQVEFIHTDISRRIVLLGIEYQGH